jgi:hypothetical protein
VVFAQAQEAAKQPNNVLIQDGRNQNVTEDMLHSLGTMSARFANFQQQSHQLAKQYVKAEKDDEKKQIRSKLGDVLAKQFDEQVVRQQKELEDLEKQIANLKALLKKRTDAKRTIIERRMDQLIQDAEGLGWNAPGDSNIHWLQQANPYSNFYPVEDKKP